MTKTFNIIRLIASIVLIVILNLLTKELFPKLNINVLIKWKIFASILFFILSNFDILKIGFDNFMLTKKLEDKEKLILNMVIKIDELNDVIITFLQDGKLSKEKIIKEFAIEEDYVCVIKSSEGFSEIWDE